jgi:hypothetical protein
MTGYDVAFKILGIIEPYAGYIIGFILFWALSKLSDKSLITIVKELIGEFGSLLERKPNAKSANALGLLLMFLLILFLFHGHLSDLLLPAASDEHASNLALQGLYVFVVLIFGAAILASLHLTKYQR